MSHQPRETWTHDYQRHGQLSIGYQSYGSQTCPKNETQFLPSSGRVDTAIWTLTKQMEKKLERNYTRKLQAILKKSWRQHPTKQQLYGYLPPITKTIKITWHAGHCWRSNDELISDVFWWTPSHGRAKAGRPARSYIQQLCADTEAMDNWEMWRERVRDIYADGVMMWLCIVVRFGMVV